MKHARFFSNLSRNPNPNNFSFPCSFQFLFLFSLFTFLFNNNNKKKMHTNGSKGNRRPLFSKLHCSRFCSTTTTLLCCSAPAPANSVFLSHHSSSSLQPPANHQCFSLTPLQQQPPEKKMHTNRSNGNRSPLVSKLHD